MRSTRSTAISTSAPEAQPDLFNRYFGLNEALAALFGRKVDLVMPGGMVNPCFATRSTARASLSMHARSPKLLEDIRDAAAFISEVTQGRFEIQGFAGNSGPDHIDQFHGMPEFLRKVQGM